MAIDPPPERASDTSQPPARFAAGVLVVEHRQRRWEAALKRQLWPGTFVRPCKTLDDVRGYLRQRSGSVVVIDPMAGGDVASVMAHLADVRLAAGVITVAPLLSVEDECVLREIGATCVLVQPVSEESLARECLRILGRI